MPVSEILSGSEQLQKGRSIPIINTKERPCPSDMITGWMQICQYFIFLVFPLFFQERCRLLRCAAKPQHPPAFLRNLRLAVPHSKFLSPYLFPPSLKSVLPLSFHNLRRQPPAPPPIVHMSGDRCVIRADAIRQEHTPVSPD